MNCPQCGHEASQFREGVCLECWEDNQNRLDLHNHEFDRWERMSDAERGDAIRRAT